MILNPAGRQMRRRVGFLREYESIAADRSEGGGHAYSSRFVDLEEDTDCVEQRAEPAIANPYSSRSFLSGTGA